MVACANLSGVLKKVGLLGGDKEKYAEFPRDFFCLWISKKFPRSVTRAVQGTISISLELPGLKQKHGKLKLNLKLKKN